MRSRNAFDMGPKAELEGKEEAESRDVEWLISIKISFKSSRRMNKWFAQINFSAIFPHYYRSRTRDGAVRR